MPNFLIALVLGPPISRHEIKTDTDTVFIGDSKK